MNDREELPSAVDTEALLALSRAHHERTSRSLGTREASGHRIAAWSTDTLTGSDLPRITLNHPPHDPNRPV